MDGCKSPYGGKRGAIVKECGAAIQSPADLVVVLASLITTHRYFFANEEDLQNLIEAVLKKHEIEYEREYRLSAHDRLDFLVNSVAIEVKVQGARNEVIRQLHRYAEHVAVSAILLVTTKARHLDMPAKMCGKPVGVASLLGGAF
jgi:hypothetical protein